MGCTHNGAYVCPKQRPPLQPPHPAPHPPTQACIGGKIIASEQIAPYRKDVLAKCYGGDISRKKKLLSKQAEGKKRMKAIGRVEVPQSAFMAVLNINRESD